MKWCETCPDSDSGTITGDSSLRCGECLKRQEWNNNCRVRVPTRHLPIAKEIGTKTRNCDAIYLTNIYSRIKLADVSVKYSNHPNK